MMNIEDRFAHLGEMSFTDLLSLENDLSENGEWLLLDDVRLELAARRTDAKHALWNLFAKSIQTRDVLPTVIGGVLTSIQIEYLISEWSQTNEASTKTAAMIFDVAERDRVIENLSIEYAIDNAEDLLRAGWTP